MKIKGVREGRGGIKGAGGRGAGGQMKGEIVENDGKDWEGGPNTRATKKKSRLVQGENNGIVKSNFTDNLSIMNLQ